MRVDSLLPKIAQELGLRVVAPLAGGEFGAVLVRDADERELVLKALPSPEWEPRFALGAQLAGRLRERGYPAPEYVGTGVALDASWSLQERLPGTVPDVMTRSHARRLCELAAMHAGAAGRRRREPLVDADAWLGTVESREETAALGDELRAVLARSARIELLEDGIVHADFHHRNYLAEGEEVTGVFDWELAMVGDWRSDLVSLAYWSAIVPWQIPPDVAAVIVERVRAECSPAVLAYFAACWALRHLDFDTRTHPDRLVLVRDAIDARVAPWWRE